MLGRFESWRCRFLQIGAIVMEGWSFLLVSEQRRERNFGREEERSKQCRYLSALDSAGGGGGRPRMDCRLLNSSRVRMWGVVSLWDDIALGPSCGSCACRGE